MHFQADIDVVVDGVAAHVHGDGAALVVRSPDPRALVASLRRTAGDPRQQLTRVADGLAAGGASVHLEGPRGRFITLGADADSSAFGVLAGTRHLSSSWRAFASTGAMVARDRRRLLVLVVGVATAAVVTARRRAVAGA